MTTTIHDPVFGAILFTKGSWLGEVRFEPTGRLVSILVRSTELRDRHRQFFLEVRERYPKLAAQVAPAIVERYPYYTENFTAARVWEEFALERIEIVDSAGKPLLLVLWYASLTERGCMLHFTFDNWNLHQTAHN